MKKKIGITFAVFNRCDFTMRCLESLFSNESKHELYVVVVDNGSTDKSVEMIKSRFPQVKIISNRNNMGCSIAWNQGLKDCTDAGCDYLSLCQNDIILSKRSIDNCLDFLEENEKFGIISPIAINYAWDSEVDLSQDELNSVSDKCMEKFGGNRDSPFCFYFFMMRPEIFENIKFDEKFKKVFYEDCDFFYSTCKDRIISAQVVDIGIVFHKHSATVSIAGEYLGGENNSAYFHKKWEDETENISSGTSYIKKEAQANIVYKRINHGIDFLAEGLFEK